jgi:opacity protein-like surface antigen
MNRPRARLLTCGTLALAAAWGAVDTHAQVSAPPPGKALVVLYRVDKQPVAARVPIIANADRLGNIANGEFVNAIVNPGKTFLRAGDRILTTLALPTAANQTYYVLIEAVPGLTPVRVELRQMPDATARRALAQSSPIGSAPAAAALAPRAPAAAAPAIIAAPRAPAPAAPAPRPAPAAAAPPKPAQPAAPRRAPPVQEEEDQWRVALIAKTGSFKLANANQVIGGLASTYDASSKPVGSLELEFRHESGFAVGGEAFYYKNTLTATGISGQQVVTAGMLNAKYYLDVANWLYPFVGAGIGYAGANFSGDLTGKSAGAAFQGMAGVDLRITSTFGIYAEYKYLSSTTSDSTGQKIKVGGRGVLGGISIAF